MAEDPLQLFWDALLSRQPERIRAVFLPLDPAMRRAVITHLETMVSEEGWHPEQIKSAQAALAAIRVLPS